MSTRDPALAAIHASEELVVTVEETRGQLRAQARQRLGLDRPEHDAAPPLRETLKRYGLGWYPLTALGTLSIVDTFQFYAFAVLAPEISRTLGVGKGAIAGAVALRTVAFAVAPLPIAALAQRKPRRAMLCLITAVLWSLFALGTGYVVLIWGLIVVLVADGLSSGSVSALHQPLLLDFYPAEARVRSLSAYQAATVFGNVLAPLAVGLLAVLGYTWRGVFIILGAVSLVAVAVAARLRDPGFGCWDERLIREAVDEADMPGAAPTAPRDDVARLGFFEIVRRLLLVPTVRRLLIAEAVFGMLLIPYQTFLFFFLEERWRMGPGARGIFFAYTAGCGIAALAVFGRFAERRFQADPAALMRLAGVILAGAVLFICGAGMTPLFWMMLVMFGISGALIFLLVPAVNTALFAVVPSHMRPHAAALAGIFLGGAGGVAGAIFLSGIDRRFGVTGSLVSLTIPGLIGAMLLASTSRFLPPDIDRMIDEIIEDEEIHRLTQSGAHLPLLSCRGVNFSYGQLQVLFGVDFTVDDGEMVALLGVNGAGKSTLLKVISGIGLPFGGSVRFRGLDITFLDAERRVRLGVAQIPGGRAVAGPLSVVENLRGFGYTIGRDTHRLDASIEACFDAFPRLAERRNQLASNLSGGEQQMLGLCKALILQPRLLLIDELSLGLAPIIVGQLLDMVRRINNDGTAVVLVEQSVNVALNLVHHAYFMEKGEIRFDGVARDLLGRDDLLRAVFLEGAGTQK